MIKIEANVGFGAVIPLSKRTDNSGAADEPLERVGSIDRKVTIDSDTVKTFDNVHRLSLATEKVFEHNETKATK